ncbi:MAG TPA: YkgJ family cysteine cluster protein [Desulfobaccales bacterium]|nr:YkgJ family cysteine cluster protein [Desulfobaccales bacterium]
MAPDRPPTVALYKEIEAVGLDPYSTFTFHCHAGLPCFNRCCRTPTVILSPYDILRLKQALGITSRELLQRYTRQELESESNLPLVLIDPGRSAEGSCPFLGAQGCLVYAHRPAACRLFPITMGSKLTADGVVDYYFRRELDYCRGFDTDRQWTLSSWMANQGFGEYDRKRRAWIEIFLRAGVEPDIEVDALVQDLFATLAYDLDKFRRLVSEPAFLQAYGVEPEEASSLRTDDLALLHLSYRLFPTLLSRDGVRRLLAVIRSSPKFFEVD